MSRLILIDGNNWGFAGNGKAPLFSGERKVQASKYVINRVREVIEYNPGAKIMVLWDGRSWRKDIYPAYKENREVYEKQRQMKAEYVAQRPDIMTGLELLGVTQVTYGNMEADDLACMLTKNAVGKNIPVQLMTADGDWQQLVQPGVTWFDIIRVKSCKHKTFKADTGYVDAEQFIEAKCIIGDKGDNVIGIHGIGPGTLDKIYQIAKSAVYFFKMDKPLQAWHWNNTFGKKLPKVLMELDTVAALKTIEFNMALVDLGTTARPKPENPSKVRKPLDEEGFEEYCGRQGFVDILRNMQEFLQPFKDNNI